MMLSVEEVEFLQRRMQDEPRELPRLRELLNSPTVFDTNPN